MMPSKQIIISLKLFYLIPDTVHEIIVYLTVPNLVLAFNKNLLHLSVNLYNLFHLILGIVE